MATLPAPVVAPQAAASRHGAAERRRFEPWEVPPAGRPQACQHVIEQLRIRPRKPCFCVACGVHAERVAPGRFVIRWFGFDWPETTLVLRTRRVPTRPSAIRSPPLAARPRRGAFFEGAA